MHHLNIVACILLNLVNIVRAGKSPSFVCYFHVCLELDVWLQKRNGEHDSDDLSNEFGLFPTWLILY